MSNNQVTRKTALNNATLGMMPDLFTLDNDGVIPTIAIGDSV
jgi:hypothetical protein